MKRREFIGFWAARAQSAMRRVAMLIVARDGDIEGGAPPFGLL